MKYFQVLHGADHGQSNRADIAKEVQPVAKFYALQFVCVNQFPLYPLASIHVQQP